MHTVIISHICDHYNVYMYQVTWINVLITYYLLATPSHSPQAGNMCYPKRNMDMWSPDSDEDKHHKKSCNQDDSSDSAFEIDSGQINGIHGKLLSMLGPGADRTIRNRGTFR